MSFYSQRVFDPTIPFYNTELHFMTLVLVTILCTIVLAVCVIYVSPQIHTYRQYFSNYRVVMLKCSWNWYDLVWSPVTTVL